MLDLMTDPQRPLLCVVSPCYNEAAGIRPFYQSLKSVLNSLPDFHHQIIFIDDGSQDTTLQTLNELAATDAAVLVYSFSRRFGHQIALTAGCGVADGDAVILMDSDLQHPPEVIPQMVKRWHDGFDIVSAIRLSTDEATLFKRWSAAAFYKRSGGGGFRPAFPSSPSGPPANARTASVFARHGFVDWVSAGICQLPGSGPNDRCLQLLAPPHAPPCR
jgi:glycosyltransferase involved in cell wall biosynthesis